MFHNGVQAGSFDEIEFSNKYPAHKFCRDGEIEFVNLILTSEPALIWSEDPFRNWTPIHWAAYSGQLECVQQVASWEPKTIHIQSSKNFQTPLHSACEGGYPLTAMWLLQVGVNPKVKDSLGETALHKAARVGSAECVELLLKVSDNIGYQNLNGQTASTVAHMSGYPNIARLISEREEAGLNAFQNRQIFPVSRMGRKRARDTICDDEICKRHRADDISTSDVANYMDTMTTSFYEHDKLCSVDFGYRNIIFEAMLSEFHGS
ncbi:ankyrin repeat domain-containing protein 10 [Trichonephila clavata]|uniref:Ankyrin repeat domain-containing protein 10 n=1 Tax=Trichonephila clavata TaxID=2740835 RepID=A0A8X6LTH5_TRICU|nr:ankyrin repeat domain-containing protein 10 [Trichonephila clavata]